MSSLVNNNHVPPSLQNQLLADRPLKYVLVASHVALMATVVFGFGLTMYVMLRHATYRQAEADLLGAAQVLIQDLSDHREGAGLTISDLYAHRFGKAPRDHAYYAVWDSAGRLLTSSPELPAHAVRSNTLPPRKGPHPFIARSQGKYLDVIVSTDSGGQLLIGRPLAKEFDMLTWSLVRLILAGTLSLILGSVGACWLANRIARPIEQMSDTAERITSRNLTQRLEVHQTPREIGRLASVINSMLDGLRHAFDRQVRFTADASHELRTPVSIILSQADFTLSRDREPAEYREALKTCLLSARRMKKLVDDLLLLARADSGQLTLRHDPIDLSDVAANVVSLLKPLAQKKGQFLESDLKSAPLLGDADRLGQVVTNLVTNAIQYSPSNTVVRIKVSAEPGAVILSVQDQGMGIAPADQPQLFNRFYRVDRARTQEDEEGTGLGLSLVAEIVAAHGGTVHVQSTEGAGTIMTVAIPTNEIVENPR